MTYDDITNVPYSAMPPLIPASFFLLFFPHPCLCYCCVCVCVCPILVCCPFFTVVLFGSLCKYICLSKRKKKKISE